MLIIILIRLPTLLKRSVACRMRSDAKTSKMKNKQTHLDALVVLRFLCTLLSSNCEPILKLLPGSLEETKYKSDSSDHALALLTGCLQSTIPLTKKNITGTACF